MKRKTAGRCLRLWVTVLCLLLLAGCSLEIEQFLPDFLRQTEPAEPSAGTEQASFDHAGFDWLTLLKSEAFAEEEGLAKLVADAVQLQVTATTPSTVTVKITAPDISGELLAWYDAQESFSGQALEAEIQRLLKGKPMETQFVLPYSQVDGVPAVIYPDGYADALSCGLSEFYDVLYGRILEQMGGTENE